MMIKRRHIYLIAALVACLFAAPLHLAAQSVPDNVDSADCVYLPEGTAWVIGTPTISTDATSLILTTPMVGDIDDDGIPEIVVTAATSGSWGTPATSINIFRPDATLKSSFPIAPCNSYFSIGMAKVQWQMGIYRTIIVTFDNSNYLHAYLHDGTQLWVSDSMFCNYYGSGAGEMFKVPCISFVDINHDGWTELLVGSEIYDAATGVLLCRDRTGNIGYAVRGSATDRIPYMAMAADLCGDSCLDLAVGNMVYNIDLQSRTTYAANQMTVVHNVPYSQMVMADSTTIPPPLHDGNTFLIDINLDGKLDVLVMNVDRTNALLYLYVWDVGGDTIICSKKMPYVRKFGTPQIGDLDNDGYPEICFVAGELEGVVSSSHDSIYALKYNPISANGEMEVFWSTPHSDRSGSTGITMFDFNQDGLVELVYRDEWNLRIINGSLIHHETGDTLTQPYDLATYSCGSSTVFEYPLIADVDLDGSAEIIVGGDVPLTTSLLGHIYIFKSGGAAWAPAREVWNQYLYCVTNVNRDLTVPLYQFDNATPFVDTSNTVRRPYNNLMQQATTIDQYGRPYHAVPDLAVDSLGEAYGMDSIMLTVSYCNQGDNTFFAPYTVLFYEGQYGGTLLGQITITEDLEVDSCAMQQLTLPYDSVNGVRNIVAVVNVNGNGIAQNGGTQAECDTVNNVLSNSRVYAVFDTTICSTEFPMMWRDSVFTEASTKHTVLRAANGMDSVLVLRLQEILATYSVVYDTVMENDLPHYFNGHEFDESVTDSAVIITNAVGCDSIISYNLFVQLNIHVYLDSTVCFDALPLIWNGVSFDTVASNDQVIVTRQLRLLAVSGVDSIVHMALTVNPIFETSDPIIICPYQRFMYRGVDYGGPASIDTVLYSVYNCDSVAHVTLTPRDTNFRMAPYYYFDSLPMLVPDTMLVSCEPAALYCVDSTIGATAWQWTLFMPDTTVNGDAATFTYLFETGKDSVSAYLTLVTTSEGDCLDTIGWPIFVFPSPVPDFDWLPQRPSILHPDVQFRNLTTPTLSDLGSGDSLAYLWRIQPIEGGDFDTTTVYEPYYKWGEEGDNMAGDYTVQLVASWVHPVDSFCFEEMPWVNLAFYRDMLYPSFTHTCRDTAEHTVTITNEYLQFPNLVTPNGDGVNDRWEVVNLVEMGNYPMNELWIYDRTGALVYHVRNIRQSEQFWDPNATRSPDGTYYFRFLAEGDYGIVKRNGTIEVLRK